MEKDCYLAPARISLYTGCYPAQFHKFTLSCICEISSSYTMNKKYHQGVC